MKRRLALKRHPPAGGKTIMHRLVSKNFLSIFPLLVVLVSCQNASSVNQAEKDINLESDNGQLDLSQFTMEQQKLERLEAEATLLEIRQNRIIIPPDDEENQKPLNDINIAQYARNSSNIVGEKIYNRLKLNKDSVRRCSHFGNADDSQRFFLSKGGPQVDLWGLDPDGDGFACDWNPNIYRNITLTP